MHVVKRIAREPVLARRVTVEHHVVGTRDHGIVTVRHPRALPRTVRTGAEQEMDHNTFVREQLL